MITKPRIHSLYLFIYLSGVAGLGYEMVWTRMFGLALGHEILAVLVVVAAFFSGLALANPQRPEAGKLLQRLSAGDLYD